MARPRTPSPILDARDAFRKNPKRKAARVNEPKSNGPIGDFPKHLDPAFKPLWDEIVECAPKGVLTKADRLLVEQAVMLLAALRALPSIKMGVLHEFLGILGKMGMTPVDRSKVQVVGTDEKADPFAAFAN